MTNRVSLNISKRLLEIAGLVHKADVLLDVGCDHGLLPVYLLNENIINRAIAVDIASGPLLSARENVKKYGLEEKIIIRKSDGFSNVKKNEADCCVIAGMGGNLILDILKPAETVWKSFDYLILSPQRDEPLVREYMGNKCLYDTDVFVFDDGKYYTAMRFLPKSKPRKLEKKETEFGINPTDDYLRHRLSVLEGILNNIYENEKKNSIIKKISKIEDDIKIIKDIL